MGKNLYQYPKKFVPVNLWLLRASKDILARGRIKLFYWDVSLVFTTKFPYLTVQHILSLTVSCMCISNHFCRPLQGICLLCSLEVTPTYVFHRSVFPENGARKRIPKVSSIARVFSKRRISPTSRMKP